MKKQVNVRLKIPENSQNLIKFSLIRKVIFKCIGHVWREQKRHHGKNKHYL